nr:serine/threonine-protein kinase [Ramlibacter ginsenosidimutans]
MKKLGRYEVLRVLGKGAMGVVYEGRDPNLDRRVAIKTVKVENLSEEAAAEYEHRFRTEARSAARLQHPNIVSVYDSDRDGDVAFLVMEYIQGDDLKHHLDRGVRYSLEQSLKIIRDLLSALDYAHKQGIVHRDIKPANLLIEPGGRVKLTDFGVARIQDSGEATRTQGSMVGTLKYMAPEQVQGQKIDSRADLFSAGVVLYQLLTDKRPFDGDNDFSIIHQIIGHHPPPPSSINPKLPAALDAVVARALAKTREERFATARDFAVALQAAIRRAEDQTVVPPLNPHKRVEGAASRPLTVPGTAPAGSGTTPSMAGASSVTQELELVYWKDVKDSTEPEELQGFLDKFPAGIYADLARRRLRKLTSGEPTNLSVPGVLLPSTGSSPYPGTGSTFASTQFADTEATRVRTDVSRPAVSADRSQMQPSKWVQEEYSATVVQAVSPASAAAAAATAPLPAAGAAAAGPGPAAYSATVPGTQPPDSTFPTTQILQQPEAPTPFAAGLETRSGGAAIDDGMSVPVRARRKVPVAALAGIVAIAIAAVVATVVLRGKTVDGGASTAAVVPAAPVAGTAAPAAAKDVPTTAAAPTVSATAAAGAAAMPPNPPVPAAPAQAKAAVTRNERDREHERERERERTTRTAKLAVPAPAPEPVRASSATAPRAEPEPAPSRPATPPVASSAGASFAAVDACRDKLFIVKELCLSEACAKPGARGHPACVRHREEVHLREESKVRQGPQQLP